MSKIALCAVIAVARVAAAQPKVGDQLPVNGAEGWPPVQWIYDAPSMTDSAGKVVVFWFCAPRLAGCTDDLARLVTLKENAPNAYFIAYINGTKAEAKKLDPIRESEGVGRGTVAFGRGVKEMFKKLGITGPLSIVVGVDHKVQLVTAGSSPADLDARDAKVTALIGAIKLYTPTVEGPKGPIKANEKFELGITITLAPWLVYSKKPGTTLDFKATVPKDIKCDNTALGREQLKPINQTLAIKMTCSGPRGSYEAAAQLQFAYDTPGGATGLGADGAKWKFEIVSP